MQTKILSRENPRRSLSVYDLVREAAHTFAQEQNENCRKLDCEYNSSEALEFAIRCPDFSLLYLETRILSGFSSHSRRGCHRHANTGEFHSEMKARRQGSSVRIFHGMRFRECGRRKNIGAERSGKHKRAVCSQIRLENLRNTNRRTSL